MKRISFMTLFAGMLFVLFSCTPKSENLEPAGANETTPESSSSEPSRTSLPAVITYDGLWFREELDGSAVKQLDIGEEVSIIGEEKPDPNNSERLYVPIMLEDGTEGWVSKWFAIPETVPGVLIQDAKIYSEPKLSKLTQNPELQPMTIVAAGEEGAVNGFIRISYATSEGYAKIDEYIKSESISKDPNDILAAHLYNLAMAAEDESMKNEFLTSASEVRSPAFGIFIDKARDGVVESTPNNLSVSTLIVMDDDVEAYEMPDVDSPIVCMYIKNDILGIIGRSEEKQVVQGVEDWWYQLEDGSWIFGASVILNK